MRRRQPDTDPMAAVPELLRDFRPDDWVPLLGRDALGAWLDARRSWVQTHGYPEPDGDPIPWLRHNIATGDRVLRGTAPRSCPLGSQSNTA